MTRFSLTMGIAFSAGLLVALGSGAAWAQRPLTPSRIATATTTGRPTRAIKLTYCWWLLIPTMK